MPLAQLMELLTLPFNLVGLVICVTGLTLAQRMARRWPGYSLAVGGFLIAATPTLIQLIAMR